AERAARVEDVAGTAARTAAWPTARTAAAPAAGTAAGAVPWVSAVAAAPGLVTTLLLRLLRRACLGAATEPGHVRRDERRGRHVLERLQEGLLPDRAGDARAVDR